MSGAHYLRWKPGGSPGFNIHGLLLQAPASFKNQLFAYKHQKFTSFVMTLPCANKEY